MLLEPCGCQGVTMAMMLLALYLNFNSGDLTNTSSHMCGSWYLPMFLFRDGSFTLINIASLMVLPMPWSSLPTVLKLSRDTSWPVMLWCSQIGNGAFMCSLNLSAKFCQIPQCILHHSPPCHTWTCRSLHSFCRMVSLSLGCTRRSLMVLPPLKHISTPCFLQMFLQLSPMPWIYGTTI